jgi:molecular chaperone GrpE
MGKKKTKVEKREVAQEETLQAPNEEQVEEGRAEADAVETPAASEEVVSLDEWNALKEQLAASEAKAAEYLEGWQRSQAEFINYKKRQQQVQESRFLDMKADLIGELLPLLDDLELALANRPKTEDETVKKWGEGIEVIYRKFVAALERQGVHRIEALGQPFDPNLHEAIGQMEGGEYESGQVAEVLRAGYQIGERVIRPALVRVAA